MLRRSSCSGVVRTSAPNISIAPPVGSTSRLIMRSVVVLPQPDGPTSAVSVPSRISSDRSCTASTRAPGNRLVTWVSRIADGAAIDAGYAPPPNRPRNCAAGGAVPRVVRRWKGLAVDLAHDRIDRGDHRDGIRDQP